VTDSGHPGLSTDDSAIPALTLVLPGDAGEALENLARAVSETRAQMVSWVTLFKQRRNECAARGDQLGQAMAQGQVLAGEHIIDHLDENIVETFDLWDQYETQVPAQGGTASGRPPGAPATPGQPGGSFREQ
jgi:hypothetical protein